VAEAEVAVDMAASKLAATVPKAEAIPVMRLVAMAVKVVMASRAAHLPDRAVMVAVNKVVSPVEVTATPLSKATRKEATSREATNKVVSHRAASPPREVIKVATKLVLIRDFCTHNVCGSDFRSLMLSPFSSSLFSL